MMLKRPLSLCLEAGARQTEWIFVVVKGMASGLDTHSRQYVFIFGVGVGVRIKVLPSLHLSICLPFILQ